jgi:hypothetical protein
MKGKVEHVEVFGPLGLPMGQYFGTHEVFKILMVCEYLNGPWCIFMKKVD